jgi:hypothetical protein
MGEKGGERQRVIKNQIEKRRKGNRTLSQKKKTKRGGKKTLTKSQ